MKKRWLFIGLSMMAFSSWVFSIASQTKMQLTSHAFKNNESIPSKYTCDGKNINPPLLISGVPKTAKSLVLIVHDPDAPSGDWTHWTLWNIAPQTAHIKENSMPKGAISGTNSFGQTGYGGPCPPPGAPHHYHFVLTALSATLHLSSRTSQTQLQKAISHRTLVQTELIGLYGRKI